MGTATGMGTSPGATRYPASQSPSCCRIMPWPSSAPNPRRKNCTPGGASASAPPSPNATSPGKDRGDKRGESSSSWGQQAGSLPEALGRDAPAFGEPPAALRGPPDPPAGRVGVLLWRWRLGRGEAAAHPQLCDGHRAAAPGTGEFVAVSCFLNLSFVLGSRAGSSGGRGGG